MPPYRRSHTKGYVVVPEDGTTTSRRRPTDLEMRDILREIRRLLDALEDERGTLLDPGEVAKQILAIRQGRVTVVPARQPEFVQIEWADWSDPDQVPVEAVGLRKSIVDIFREAEITTVGLVIKHNQHGLMISRARLGPRLLPLLLEGLQSHGLQLADDNSGLPIEFIIGRRSLQLFGWWTQDDQRRFAESLGLEVLGDLPRLTSQQIAGSRMGTYQTSGDQPIVREMSGSNPADVQFVVEQLNQLLGFYRVKGSIV